MKGRVWVFDRGPSCVRALICCALILIPWIPTALWRQYVQLTEVETAFRALKSELAIRPIWHRIQRRVEAHILVAFLGYCLWACLKQKLKVVADSIPPCSRECDPLGDLFRGSFDHW